MLNLSSFRIVVVEDNDTLSSILEDFFADRGAKAVYFDNADDALVAILQEGKPDLLITDQLLPGQLKGTDLVQLLLGRWPDLPTVLTTGYGYEIGRDLPAQVVYLQKPWLLDALEKAIADAFR
ncbi:response regulator [Pseudomonas oryzihabitans]|uniref:response regulator n=1 Tax=Pseudomonas oryzihabitans TaxID=47885 RepID=UPI0028940A59|nr:response regulator [Pseudomonas oryzihabitans]MDT3722663.1 response regulator [Pseudomonas oryzihabitans]